MKTIRVVICDLNPQDLRFYEELCRRASVTQSVSVKIECYESVRALQFALGSPVFCKNLDLLFFALPADGGAEEMIAVRQTGYSGLIVFLGDGEARLNYEKVFDADIFNYVTKGREKAHILRFANVFERAVAAVVRARSEKLLLTYGGEIRQIEIEDILYFESQDKALIVHYGKGEQFTFVSPISKMEMQMRGRNFLRVAQSFLVSVDHVKSATYKEAVLRDGTTIPVGRKYWAELKAAMEKKAVTP